MLPPPDHSWIEFEDSLSRRVEPHITYKLPETLTDPDYVWVKQHMALAGIELSKRQPPPFRPDYGLIGHGASLMWPFRPELQPLPMNGRA